jgi:hypothetical protein
VRLPRLHRLRRGSVLIIVVALLVLMAVIGTAYVSTARVDRGAAATGSFNTEIDLLIQGVEDMAQIAISQDVTNNFWTASASPTDYTSPMQQPFLGSRTPVLVNGSPAWLFMSAAPITTAVFESPFNQAGTPAAPAVLQYGQDRQNMVPTSVPVTDPTTGITAVYPALMDPKYPNTKFLAASASGDGIADSGLFRLPIGEINGVTYYAAVRIIDNNSAVNASTAWINNSNPTGNNIYGDFFPSNVNLDGLVADGHTGINSLGVSALNMNYRCSPLGSPPLQPIDDTGNPRADFNFISPYDAMWMQLGRRLGNPGYMTATQKYQALPMTECGTLAYHFCIPNSSASPSLLEQYFPQSLRPASIRMSPYAASDVTTWWNAMFNYSLESPGTPTSYLPRRPLITARNGVSNFTLNKFTSSGLYSGSVNYTFGDMVQLANNQLYYVCIEPVVGIGPLDPTGSIYWTVEPWADHVLKTSINTATFDQLWLAYWNVMTDSNGNVPTGADTTLFRSPIRNPAETTSGTGGGTVAGAITPSGGDDTQNIQNVINSAPPGSTVNFAAGTFKVSSTLTFQNSLTYVGAGGALPPSLTPPEVLKMRAAIAAVNALTIRGGGNDVISRLVYLGPPAATGGTGSGGGASTLDWIGPNNNFLITTPSNPQNITIEGLTFDSAGVQLNGNATNVNLIGDTIQNVTGSTQDNDPWDDGLYVSGSFISSSVVACTITNINGDEAMQIFSPDQGSQITDNVVTNCWNGIHIDFYNQGQGTVVARNNVSGIHRNAIEIQGDPNGLTVRDNYVHDWVNQSANSEDAHMGYSIATGGQGNTNGNNINIINNVCMGTGPDMNTPPQPAINFTAFELMGLNVSVANNYLSNMGTAQLNDGPLATSWSTTNNIWCGLTGCTNGQTTGSPVIDGPAPNTNSGNQTFTDPNAVPPPHLGLNQPPPGSTTGTGTPPPDPSTTFSVMVYGTARNPYITKVYADNDSSLTGGGYVAVELYNPYTTSISLKNWELATLARPSGVVIGVPITPLASTQQQWGQNGSGPIPTIPPHSFLTLVSSSTPPPQYTNAGPAGTVVVLSDLTSALNNELVLLRPRRGDGTWSSSSDPTNTFQEDPTKNPNAVQDLVPVDSYDFTGLTSSSGGNTPVEWYYARPDDPSQNDDWHFVYPGAYSIAASSGTTGGNPAPRLTATTTEPVGTLSTGGLANFGTYNPSGTSATLSPYHDTALQLDNVTVAGHDPVNSSGNLYPFGGFARNGDILHCPFIGAYRIQVTTSGELVELNPVTIDSTYAKLAQPATDAVTEGENIGRFTPIIPITAQGAVDPAATVIINDYSTNTSPYHFATQLFDYFTVNAPDDDYLPNYDPNPSNQFLVPAYPGPAPQPVANVKPSMVNSTRIPTEETVPVEGLININTAPWPVLATLPFVADAENPANVVANANVAKAIVYFRDVDDGTGPAGSPHPHGPFKSIWELNEVAVNTPSINGGTPNPSVNDPNDPTFSNLGAISFLQTVGTYTTNNYNPATSKAGNEDGDLYPQPSQGSANQVVDDFQSQNLALTRISNLITTRSDMYTVYVLVQGWRNVGTSTPSLVVQRRAAFLADRTGVTDTNQQMTITNIPND